MMQLGNEAMAGDTGIFLLKEQFVTWSQVLLAQTQGGDGRVLTLPWLHDSLLDKLTPRVYTKH